MNIPCLEVGKCLLLATTFIIVKASCAVIGLFCTILGPFALEVCARPLGIRFAIFRLVQNVRDDFVEVMALLLRSLQKELRADIGEDRKDCLPAGDFERFWMIHCLNLLGRGCSPLWGLRQELRRRRAALWVTGFDALVDLTLRDRTKLLVVLACTGIVGDAKQVSHTLQRKFCVSRVGHLYSGRDKREGTEREVSPRRCARA